MVPHHINGSTQTTLSNQPLPDSQQTKTVILMHQSSKSLLRVQKMVVKTLQLYNSKSMKNQKSPSQGLTSSVKERTLS